MSKHSTSTKHTFLTTQTTSFFDGATDVETFWKQVDNEEENFAKYPLLIEGEFALRKKAFFKEWEKCQLQIKGNFLIFNRKKKSSHYIEYIDFDEKMYRIDKIRGEGKKPSAKYPYGFTLYSNGKSFDFYCKEAKQLADWMTLFARQCIMTDFYENYKTLDLLGMGGYGKVYMLEHIKTKKKYAGKFMRLAMTNNKERQKVMIMNEIRMLKRLNHPQIVTLHEVYEMAGQICVVMEYLPGDKLFNYIVQNRTLSEKTTAAIIKQLLLILCYLEEKDIIHRDIKPENILYTLDDKGKIRLKLIDFGLGTFHQKRDIITKCGTAGFVAPEVLNNQPYGFKADLFSVGIIMFMCLTGRPVFVGRDYEELLAKNKRGSVKFRGSAWSRLSHDAQDLIQRFLEPNPNNRIFLNDAMNHEWLIKNIYPEDRTDLNQHVFKVIKLNIPQENTITKIPTTPGQIPFVVSRHTTNSGQLTSGQRFSTSFIASNLFASMEPQELNSFYRINSQEPSSTSGLSSVMSKSSFNGSFMRGLTLPPNLYNPQPVQYGNTLQLPTVQLKSPRKLNSRTHLNEIQTYQDAGYFIQISHAVSIDLDLDTDLQEEGSFCSEKYEVFAKKAFRSRLPLAESTDFDLEKVKKFSLGEKVSTLRNFSAIRYDTEMETPRIKNKVIDITNKTRGYLTTSFEEAFSNI